MAKNQGCLLQLEYRRKNACWHLGSIAEESMKDTLKNGGTFVMVVDVDADKVTIVQRPDAEKL